MSSVSVQIMNSTKKVSFGFKKLSIKPINATQKQNDDIEYIRYLDDPIKNTQNKNENENQDFNIVNKTRKHDMNIIENENDDTSKSTNIIEKETNDADMNNNKWIFSISKRVIESEEPSISDYNDVPVDGFGKKMICNLGWTESSGVGRKRKHVKVLEQFGRPSGLGLGANLNKKQKKSLKVNEKLEIKKGAYVKIIAGDLIYNYGEIQGFSNLDRVVVKLVNNEHTEVIEDYLEPITSSEYKKHSKIINNVEYERYVRE